jgi:hypothetical protein
MVYNSEKSKNITSFNPLLAAGVMKTLMKRLPMKTATAENIDGSGLCLQHLRTTVSRDGEDGLRNTFTTKNDNGLPRVTNIKNILDKVVLVVCLFGVARAIFQLSGDCHHCR